MPLETGILSNDDDGNPKKTLNKSPLGDVPIRDDDNDNDNDNDNDDDDDDYNDNDNHDDDDDTYLQVKFQVERLLLDSISTIEDIPVTTTTALIDT